ncbi:ATP-binding protein [Streptomyces sp. NPDC004111]|uniref:ATP-binding protein n=1 Tax=Streptomyces sp. NPDC004111 TaxID=3364690 RepID=UPI00369314B3
MRDARDAARDGRAPAPDPFGLTAVLRRLDTLLAAALVRAEEAYGAEAAGDRFRGLHIDAAEVVRLIRRAPGEPLLSAGGPAGEPFADGTRPAVLRDRYGLSAFDLDVLVVALAPELDLRYERLYGYLQDEVTKRRPTVDLALHLLCATAEERLVRREHFQGDAPLVRGRLLRPVPEAAAVPLLARPLVLDDQIVAHLLGNRGLDARLAGFAAWSPAGGEGAGQESGRGFHRVADLLAAAAEEWRAVRVHLRGAPGSGQREVAEAAARRAGRVLLVADLGRAPVGFFRRPDEAHLLFREAEFRGAPCFVEGVDVLLAHDRRAELSAFMAELGRSTGPVVLAGAEPWPAAPLPAAPASERPAAPVHRIDCPPPDAALRAELWRAELSRAGLRLPAATRTALAHRFRLTGPQIAQAVSLARDATAPRCGRSPAPDDLPDALFAAARSRTGDELGALAVKVDAAHRWEDLVLPPDSLDQLRELCARVAHRERVLNDWGFGARLTLGRGVCALFAGPPGTGKTMAAGIVARELGIDLYRIDLAGVVSKWIGETEKNLDRIFAAAATANAVLLFDEADALFGKRSEVRDAHDRYANIEVSYLLQKMESYDGIALLASNRPQNLDEAFLRRLGFVVRFPFPEEERRRSIWERAFPGRVPLAAPLDLAALAREFPLSGAEIRNVALAAAYLAAAAGTPVTAELVLRAVRREYEKAGRGFPAAGEGGG